MQLWSIWLKGVGWAKCTMSHTNSRREPFRDCGPEHFSQTMTQINFQ